MTAFGRPGFDTPGSTGSFAPVAKSETPDIAGQMVAVQTVTAVADRTAAALVAKHPDCNYYRGTVSKYYPRKMLAALLAG